MFCLEPKLEDLYMCSSYDMTPPVKKYTPPTSENYNIDNISSEDSTDDEGAPKKKIPSWAVGTCLLLV